MAESKDGLTSEVRKMVQPLKIDLGTLTRTTSIFNANQVQKIFNSTQERYKYKRPGKGGAQFTYVKTSYVRRALDGIFGFNWDFEITTPDDVAFQMAVMTGYITLKGKLTGRTLKDGVWHTITREQYGRAEVKFLTEKQGNEKVKKIDSFTQKPIPLDFGNDMKAAASDALKKCASMLGIAGDVYDPDEFVPYEIQGSTEADERSKNASKMAKEVGKKIIDAPAKESK